MGKTYVQNLKKLFFLFCWALFLGTPAIESLFLERFSYSWSAAFFAVFLIVVIFLCFDTLVKKYYKVWVKALAVLLVVICFLNFLQGYFFAPINSLEKIIFSGGLLVVFLLSFFVIKEFNAVFDE
jgi:hypothetical protein